jgi:F-type H+-transporting ATPase subunit epsilon
MTKPIRCSIVTPTQTVLDEDVLYASVPAWDGQLGVMAGASPLLTKLGVGGLRLNMPGGGDRWFLLDGGFAQIEPDKLNLISEAAIPADQINVQEAEAELAEANARVTTSGKEYPKVLRDQQRALAKKALATAHAGRS